MLKVDNVSFAYQNKEVLSKIHFSIKKGEHIALMGESGCGKSTLLKALYGLFDIEKGIISYHGEKLLGPAFHLVPGHKFMKYLAQEFDLMPYISAAENVGEFLSNFYPIKKKKRIAKLLEVVGMTDFANVEVKYLSGGQKQRIALARVLALEPEVLLLDEPFSQIDNFKKHHLRYQLFEYIKQQQITCITATHDKEDVLPFADQVLILKDGKQLSLDTPQNTYDTKKNKYIASLFSEISVIPKSLFYETNSRKKLIVYPHEIVERTSNGVEAKVESCYFKGQSFLLHIRHKKYLLKMESERAKDVGDSIIIGLKNF